MQNRIGKGLMQHESIPLEVANIQCDMCLWLEKGYEENRAPQGADLTEDEQEQLSAEQAYATEILLHRRMFHLTADYPN